MAWRNPTVVKAPKKRGQGSVIPGTLPPGPTRKQPKFPSRWPSPPPPEPMPEPGDQGAIPVGPSQGGGPPFTGQPFPHGLPRQPRFRTKYIRRRAKKAGLGGLPGPI